MIQLNPKERIAKISIGWSVCNSIIGLRTYDDEDKMIVNDNWWDIRGYNPNVEECKDGSYEADLKLWITHLIPERHEIIGLKWHKDK